MQCIRLARVNQTPVPFWLSLRLTDLRQWVTDSNEVTEEHNRQTQQRYRK